MIDEDMEAREHGYILQAEVDSIAERRLEELGVVRLLCRPW